LYKHFSPIYLIRTSLSIVSIFISTGITTTGIENPDFDINSNNSSGESPRLLYAITRYPIPGLSFIILFKILILKVFLT